MIVDPLAEVFKKTATSTFFPLPTATKSAHSSVSVTPLPTVVPTPSHHAAASAAGVKSLWVVFVIMLVASAAFTFMAWSVPVSKRLYHVITTLITIIAAISYFAMATQHGVVDHHYSVTTQKEGFPPVTEDYYRQVYIARYIDWSLTTPLLLLDLALLAGMNGAHITMAVLADIIMILTGLFAAFGTESNPQKWGWYTIACIAYLVIVWHLALNGRATVAAKGNQVANFYYAIAGFTVLLWTAYPIIWGFADGAHIMSVDQEINAYAVLDVLAKPVFGAWLLITHSRIAETNVEVGGFWAHGLNREGALRLGDDDGA